tara:strand:+ start:25423 stop:26556 length:1134 start_codon:yes stop_codon:yes gene_type:complete
LERIKILRIGNLPTSLNPGQGEAAHQLFKSRFFNTIMFSPSDPCNAYDKEINLYGNNLFYIPFPNKIFPKNITFFKRIFLSSHRLKNIFYASINILKNKVVYSQKIIHIHHIFFAIPAIILKFLGKKIVITIHGSDIHKINNSNLLRSILKLFDLVLVVSLYQKKILAKFLNQNKIKYIGNAVDCSFYKNEINYDKRENIIINIGSLRWQKNQKLLLEVFNEIYKIFPSWKLIILGEGEERKNMEKYISSNNLNEIVLLKGSVDKKQVNYWLNKSKIFIMCSLTEGFPKALLEASACGCASISTNVGDCPDFLQNIGLVSHNNNKKDLYLNIFKLINDQDLAKYFSKKAINKVKKYSWESYIKIHKELYLSLLNKKN